MYAEIIKTLPRSKEGHLKLPLLATRDKLFYGFRTDKKRSSKVGV